MKFTINVTTFNKCNFLQECIDSVYAQTYKEPFQLIVVNDASDDAIDCSVAGTFPEIVTGSKELSLSSTKAYLDYAMPTAPHIKRTIIHNEKNLGVQKAFNVGAYYAEGNWILMLDHDDKLMPECLTELSKFIDEEDKQNYIGLIYTDLITDTGQVRTYPDFVPGYIASCFQIGNLTAYKRTAFEEVNGWRIDLDYGHDTAIVVDMIENGWQIKHMPKAVYWNRLHEEQYTQQYVKQGKDPRRVHQWIVNRTVTLRPELWIEARENTAFGGYLQHWKAECEALRPWCKGVGIELGCGRRKRLPFAIGVDRDRADAKIPEIICDVEKEELPFSDNSLDYILAAHLLEAMEDPAACIRAWMKKLKPGGYLLLIMPDTDSPKVPKIGQRGADPEHKWNPSPDVFKKEIMPKVEDIAVLFQFDTLQRNEWSFDAFLRKE